MPDAGSWNYAFSGVKWSAGMKYGLKLANPKAFFDGARNVWLLRLGLCVESRWRGWCCTGQLTCLQPQPPILPASLPLPLTTEAHRATHFLDFAGIEEGQGSLVDGVEDHFA